MCSFSILSIRSEREIKSPNSKIRKNVPSLIAASVKLVTIVNKKNKVTMSTEYAQDFKSNFSIILIFHRSAAFRGKCI